MPPRKLVIKHGGASVFTMISPRAKVTTTPAASPSTAPPTTPPAEVAASLPRRRLLLPLPPLPLMHNCHHQLRAHLLSSPPTAAPARPSWIAVLACSRRPAAALAHPLSHSLCAVCVRQSARTVAHAARTLRFGCPNAFGE